MSGMYGGSLIGKDVDNSRHIRIH